MNYIKISVRSLLLRWRQYFSLFLVCAFGVGFSLFCLFLVQGMLDSLKMKAKIYYGGDYQFVGGYNDDEFFTQREYVKKIEGLLPKNAVVSPRLDYSKDEAAFYFEGMGVRERIFKGVDFNREEKLFENFNYVAGDAKSIAGTNGVLLSEPIAKMLDVSIGDSVTLKLQNVAELIDTTTLIVKGIFRDSSVFGMYTAYLDYDFLRTFIGYPDNYCNRIVLYFPKSRLNDSDTKKIQSSLSKEFNMYKIVDDKYDFLDPLRHGGFDKETFALLPLSTNMQDLNIVIDAMHLVSVLVIVALVIIIVVGISSTYRVIVMKRINEIGIYKAIGMERKSIFGLLSFETISLLLSGCFAGLVICTGLCSLIQLFNFSFIPAFDVFLKNGYVVPTMSLSGIAAVFAVVLVTTLLAVLFSVRDAVRKMPCDALAVTE